MTALDYDCVCVNFIRRLICGLSFMKCFTCLISECLRESSETICQDVFGLDVGE